MRRTIRAAALAASILGTALPPLAAGEPATRPNIVIFYADDLGWGDIGPYGATRVRTPNLDRLAAEGLRFTDAHSAAATCTPSRYALLTGEYAWRREGTGILPGDAALIIEPGRPTLASILKGAGYATGLVGKWHLGLGRGNIDWNGPIEPGPLEVGFDRCFIVPATNDRVPCVYVEDHRVVGLDPADPIRVSYRGPIGEEPTGRDHPELLRMRSSHGHDMTIVDGIGRIGSMTGGRAARWVDADMGDTIVRKSVEFIEMNAARRFFLLVSTHDIHVPRVPHPRFVGTTDMGPRGDAIAGLDACVGDVLAALEKAGIAGDTLFIFTSDNGPVLDDGYRDEAAERLGDHRPAGPWRGGKYSNFEGGTRVPLIVRWPGRIEPGTSSALVGQVDFLASLAALAGQPLAAGAGPDSVDVLPALLGKSPAGRDHLVEQAGALSVRRGDWKLIAPGKGPRINRSTKTELGNDPEPQLYDLKSDPGETRNVAAEHAEPAKELLSLLERIRSRPREARAGAR